MRGGICMEILFVDNKFKNSKALKKFFEGRSDKVHEINGFWTNQGVISQIERVLSHSEYNPMVIIDLFLTDEEKFLTLGQGNIDNDYIFKKELYSVAIANMIIRNHPNTKLAFMTSIKGNYAKINEDFHRLKHVMPDWWLFKKPVINETTGNIDEECFYPACSNERCRIKFKSCSLSSCFYNQIKNIYDLIPEE